MVNATKRRRRKGRAARRLALRREATCLSGCLSSPRFEMGLQGCCGGFGGDGMEGRRGGCPGKGRDDEHESTARITQHDVGRANSGNKESRSSRKPPSSGRRAPSGVLEEDEADKLRMMRMI